MSDANAQTPPGWYYAAGDPPGTQRYWDGSQWQGGPQPVAAGGAPGSAVGGLDLADPGKRVLGRFIDYIIWFIVIIIIAAVFGGATANDGGFNVTTSGTGFVASVISVLAIAAYETFMVGSRGQTLGKMVTSTKVVHSDGSALDMAAAAKRIAPYAIGIIPVIGGIISFIIGIAGLVLLFTDNRNQTPWDKFADSVVVNT